MKGATINIHIESKKYTECHTGSIRDKQVSMPLFLLLWHPKKETTFDYRITNISFCTSLLRPGSHWALQNKIGNNEKKGNRARDDGRREKSLPSSSACFLFLTLPSLPTTQRGLCEGQGHFTVSQTDIPPM